MLTALRRGWRPAVLTVGWALVGLLLTGRPGAAQSQTAADTFQPWHAVMFRSVLSADVSPDGRQIAFLRSRPRRPLEDDSGRAWVELYVLDPDGREVPFDLAVVVPLHGGADYVGRSPGLGDELNWKWLRERITSA